MRSSHSHAGFTLIEMTLVLAIIGFTAGGVIIGQSMIRTSQAATLGRDLLQYASANNQFVARYKGFPGDIPNASSYWGAADGSTGSTAACSTTSSLNVKTTCNGNGDRMIDHAYGAREEIYRAWQHMANAGLITGNFTGICGTGCSASVRADVIGTNTPQSRVAANVGYAFSYRSGPLSGDADFFDGNYQFNTIGLISSGAARAMLPNEASDFDKKYDDGMPATGKIFAYKSNSASMTNCTNGTTITAGYAVDGTTRTCNPVMALQN